MPTRKLLLLGAAGFLGRYIAREFQQHDWAVHGLDSAPPQNAPSGIDYDQMTLPSHDLIPFVAGLKPNACIHAAGRASVGLSMERPDSDFYDGVVVTFELLNA